ncbi:MAG: hypothetical protein CME01_13250 [Geminicoccus sp.]|nr:hypothetical protein [Geminicoccus sp.]
MMTTDPVTAARLREAHPAIFDAPWYRRYASFVLLGGLSIYLLISFFAMGLQHAARDFRQDNFRSATLDFYSYIEELNINYRRPEQTKFHRQWSAFDPDSQTITAVIHNKYDVIIKPDGELTFSLNDEVIARFGLDENGTFAALVTPATQGPDNQVSGHPFTYKPKFKGNGTDLLNAQIRFTNGSQLKITKGGVRIKNRRLGWEYFWFGEGHELTEMTGAEFWAFMRSNETREISKYVRNANGLRDTLRLDVAPWRYAWHSFLNNDDWKHKEVYDKALQSLAMAYCGLIIAAFLAAILAFPAAQNISNVFVSFLLKRFMDLIRAIDHLFWALIFIRGGFGQGMLSGISAFAVVETGTLGKLMAEAIENIDSKQPEGVQSTGASEMMVRRYGIIPQVLPVFVSQTLYFFESNVRSATVIGAVCGAGLGLQILNNATNGTDWEDIAYAALIIITMVMVIDSFTNWLRGRLIGIGRSR